MKAVRSQTMLRLSERNISFYAGKLQPFIRIALFSALP